MKTPKLSPIQEEALGALAAKIAAVADKPRSGGLATPIHEPSQSNVLGILGVRGAGKSTLLMELYTRWAAAPAGGHTGRLQDTFLLRPLDCSVLSPGTEPGTGVLLHLRGELLRRDELDKALKKWLKELESLIGRYTRVEESYRELCLELASSPGDYSRYVTDGLQERFDLRKDLAFWLSVVLDHMKRTSFAVLLDDFDLVPAEEARRWFASLLDELRQPRLIFVVTADFYRLEHLSFDPSTEFDDKTGRALLAKLLPVQSRVSLERWKLDSRKDFKPDPDDSDTLWDLVKRAIDGTDLPEPLVASLLPARPRGLVDLHESLVLGLTSEDRTVHLLHLLATSRNESLLARLVTETKPEDWVQTLRFAEEDVSVEDWRTLIDAAASRLQATGEAQPLRHLRPVVSEQGLQQMPAGTADRTPQSVIVSGEAPIPFGYDPAAPDPLRHDWLRILPLRDAPAADQPLWAELFIDLGLPKSARNRVYLLRTWQPLARRLARARFRLAVSHRDLCRFFEDHDNSKLRPALYWLRVPAGPHAELGWEPLIEALRGSRDPLLSELLSELLIDSGGLGGDLPGPETDKALALLPDRLWALLLLIDALERCPWAAFSAPLGWRIVTFLGLAAAFVRSSYAHAIAASGRNDKGLRLSKPQAGLVEMLDRRDPRGILSLQEEEVLARLRTLFGDGLEGALKDQHDPVARAALAYLESPVYTSVVDLIPARPEAGRRAARKQKGKSS